MMSVPEQHGLNWKVAVGFSLFCIAHMWYDTIVKNTSEVGIETYENVHDIKLCTML